MDDRNEIQVLIDFNDMTLTEADENLEIRLYYKKKSALELLYEIIIGIVGAIFLCGVLLFLCKHCSYKKIEIDGLGNKRESVDICTIY